MLGDGSLKDAVPRRSQPADRYDQNPTGLPFNKTRRTALLAIDLDILVSES